MEGGRDGERERGRDGERKGERDRKAEAGRGHWALGHEVNIGSLNTGDTVLLWPGPTEGLNVSSIYIQVYCRSQHCHLPTQQADSVSPGPRRSPKDSSPSVLLPGGSRWHRDGGLSLFHPQPSAVVWTKDDESFKHWKSFEIATSGGICA